MDDYQKLTDAEISESFESLKKELVSELFKLPESNENETVNLIMSENVSCGSSELECKRDNTCITSQKIHIEEYNSPSQMPKSRISSKAEDINNHKETSIHKCNRSHVNDTCVNKLDVVSTILPDLDVVSTILPDLTPDIRNDNVVKQSVACKSETKETDNAFNWEEEIDFEEENKISFVKIECVEEEEDVKYNKDIRAIKTEESSTMNIIDRELDNPENEEEYTRNQKVNLISDLTDNFETSGIISASEIHKGVCPYECHHCKKKFTHSHNLKAHLRIHDVSHLHECTLCKKRFTQSGSLKAHMRIHDGIRPYECPHCQKKFTLSGRLKMHLRIHEGVRPFECQLCKKKFTFSGNLKVHLRIHEGIRPYECHQCKKSYAESGSLKRHLAMHDGIRPYECHHCKARFVRRSVLNRHLRLHEGIRPYECLLCKMKFSQKGYLNRHLRIHDGIRPYECPQCKRKFTQSGTLKRHLRVHDGSRLYECSRCEKKFTHKGTLKRHLRIHEEIRS